MNIPLRQRCTFSVRACLARAFGGITLGVLLSLLPAASGASLMVADRPAADTWVPDGTVNAVLEQVGVVYLGGKFSSLRPNRGPGLALDLSSLAALPAFPQVNGEVLAVAPDHAGGFFLGGDFTRVGGLARTNLAYIGPDQRVKAWAPAVNGRVLALAWAGGVVYVGGEFTAVGGQPRTYLAAVGDTTGLVTVWNPAANGAVSVITVSGSTVHVAGSFTQIGGAANLRSGLAAIDAEGSGQVLAWNPAPAGGPVNSLLEVGDVMFVGGGFTNLGGVARTRLAAVDIHTGQATTWNLTGTNAVNGDVEALASDGSVLYVGGRFTQIAGVGRNGLAALTIASASAAATAWNPVLTAASSAQVSTLALAAGRLFVGGSFTNAGGSSANGLAVLDAATALPKPWNVKTTGAASRIAVSFRTAYVAGAVLSPASVPRRNAAALDLATGQPTAWNPGVDGEVFSLLGSGGFIHLGGRFQAVGGQPLTNLARVGIADGLPQVGWNPQPDGPVRALAAASGGALYVGGDFLTIGGSARRGIALLDGSGLAANWNPDAGGAVYALAATAGSVYAGGAFTNIGGQPRRHLAEIKVQDGSSSSWNPSPDNVVRAIQVVGTNVFAAGEFTQIGNLSRRGVAALDAAGAATPWNGAVGGDVRALAVAGDLLYVGGCFEGAGGQPRSNLAALSLTDGLATAWDPAPSGCVLGLSARTNRVFVGGAFVRSGATYQPRLAYFPAIGSPQLFAQPEARSAAVGASVVFSVIAGGLAPLSYQWSWNGSPLPGATGDALSLVNLDPSRAGSYTVTVSNLLGRETSQEAILTVVQPPSILVQPQSLTVLPGTDVTLGVSATGSPAPQFSWRRNGTVLPDAIGPELSLPQAQAGDGGAYSVMVFNDAGTIYSSVASLVVSVAAHPFTDQFADRVALPEIASGTRSGSNVNASREPLEPNHAGGEGGASVWCSWKATQTGLATFTTRGSSFDTLLAIYNDGPDPGSLTLLAADDDRGGAGTSKVAFSASAGTQYLIAIDGSRGQTGRIVLDWRLEPGAGGAPVVLGEPASVSTQAGSGVTFSVAASDSSGGNGGPPLQYRWFRNGRSIPGSTNATLALANVQERDLGLYQVSMTSMSGRTEYSQPATLGLGRIPRLVPRSKLIDRDAQLLRISDLIADPLPSPLAQLIAAATSFSNPATTGATVTSSFVLNPPRDPRTVQPTSVSAPLCSRTFIPQLVEFTNDITESVAVMVETVGTIGHLLAAYSGSASDPLHNNTACAVTLPGEFSDRIRFRAEPGLRYTVLIGSLTDQSAVVTYTITVCRRPAITLSPDSPFTGGGVELNAVAGLAGCEWRYWWYRNSQLLPGVDGPVLTQPYPPQLGTYSLVISNCVGFVSNVVADFTSLVLQKTPVAGSARLSTSTTVSRPFVVEICTNLSNGILQWQPFHTNGPTRSLPITIPTALATGTLGVPTNALFRIRPGP